MAPVVSIVIPFNKRFDLLKETLRSVEGQEYQSWQQILVDDSGATTLELLSLVSTETGPGKTLLIGRNRLPAGAATSRNLGWQNSQGDYIVFLDSDDLLAPFCLTQRVGIMEANPDLDFAVFPMLIFSDNVASAEYAWNVATREEDVFRFLRTDAVWQTSGAIWRRSALEKINGFTEGLQCWQDLDIHLKALLQNLNYKKFYDLPPDCYYRKHSQGSISQERINTPEKLNSRLHLFQAAVKLIETKTGDKTLYYENIRLMANGILLSAIRALQFSFFMRMFLRKEVWRLLNGAQRVDLLLDGFYYFGRIYRFLRLSKHRPARSERHLLPSEIGKHVWIKK